MLANSNRIPNTVISRTFVAELIRDLCYFATSLGENDGQRPLQCLSTISDRMKLLHELCECEPELAPYLLAEFRPIFSSIIASFSSHFVESDDNDDQKKSHDQLLSHFLAVVSAMIISDFGSFFEDSHDIDYFLSLCFALISRMNSNSMAKVRFLSSANEVPNVRLAATRRLVAHCAATNFVALAAFVLQNSLNYVLINSLWQFLHALSTVEFTADALPDLLPALNTLASTDPSILSQKFSPGAPPTEADEQQSLPLLTLSNLLRIYAPRTSDVRKCSEQKESGQMAEENERQSDGEQK